jgi:hypothetical protein
MCYDLNLIFRQGRKVADWSELNLGHEDLMRELEIDDGGPLITRKHVKAEAHPKVSWTSTSPDDWEIEIDEKGTLPEWYTKDPGKWFELGFRQVLKFIKLAKAGKFKGSIQFGAKYICTLGDIQTIGGDADFEGSQVKEVPQLQTIGGNADFEGSQVKVPQLQTIGGDADFYNSQVKVPQLQTIGGDADFEGSQVKVPQLQTIGGNADFYNSQVKVPQSCKIKGSVYR